MNYKIVKIASFYRDYLKYYYAQFPEISSKSYSEQYTHLMSQGYAWSDYFQRYLSELGNEAHEIVSNAAPMQQAWAAEHSVAASADIVFEQLKYLKPEVVFIQDMRLFTTDYLAKIRNEIKSVRLIFGHCCSPFTTEHFPIFRNYDFLLSCSPHFTAIFDQQNIKSHLLYHGFEHTHIEKINQNNSAEETDVLFIGSFMQNKDFHDDRLKLVEYLLDKKLPLTIFTNLNNESCFWLKSKQLAYLVSKGMKEAGLAELTMKIPMLNKVAILNEIPKKSSFSEQFKRNVNNKSIFGLDMLKTLSKAKIGLNFHGGIGGDYAANVRLFEVTGAGSVLVTDNKKNMNQLFEPDKEVVTFDTFGECEEKITYLLNHPAEAEKIAKAGQQRVLRDHTLQKRVGTLHEIITEELKN